MSMIEMDLISLVTCQECGKLVKRIDTRWVRDRYGIPYKRCCPACYDSVSEIINKWKFDEADAGERLEDDY